MAKARKGPARGGKKSAGKGGTKAKVSKKSKKGQDIVVEGEAKTTKKKYGEVIDEKADQAIFDCPVSVHGIDADTPESEVGHVRYAQRFSKDLGGMWATIEFELKVPCHTDNYQKAQQWARTAVGDTIDAEYEELVSEDDAEETDWD